MENYEGLSQDTVILRLFAQLISRLTLQSEEVGRLTAERDQLKLDLRDETLMSEELDRANVQLTRQLHELDPDGTVDVEFDADETDDVEEIEIGGDASIWAPQLVGENAGEDADDGKKFIQARDLPINPAFPYQEMVEPTEPIATSETVEVSASLKTLNATMRRLWYELFRMRKGAMFDASVVRELVPLVRFLKFGAERNALAKVCNEINSALMSAGYVGETQRNEALNKALDLFDQVPGVRDRGSAMLPSPADKRSGTDLLPKFGRLIEAARSGVEADIRLALFDITDAFHEYVSMPDYTKVVEMVRASCLGTIENPLRSDPTLGAVPVESSTMESEQDLFTAPDTSDENAVLAFERILEQFSQRT